MSDKTPTAVGWLIQQLSSSRYFYSIMEELESRSTIVQPNSILHQAIEMEKNQINAAYIDGLVNWDNTDGNLDYYTNTYKP